MFGQEIGIIIAVISLVLVNGLYLVAIYHIIKHPEEKDLYQIITMSFWGHFANWGISEWYIVNGYWYMLGISYFPSVNELYWFMAWVASVYPFAVGFTLIVFYFVSGIIDLKNELEICPKHSYPGISTSIELIEYINKKVSTIPKMLLFTILSIGTGMGLGNLTQDRICGALCLLSSKLEYRWFFWEMYTTFMFDPLKGIFLWVLPILIFAIVSTYLIYFR